VKLSKARVGHLAESLISRLQETDHLDILGEKKAVIEALDRAMTAELSVEDRLNAEIRELMKQYDVQIERGGVDYQKMFTMIKSKLVKERGLIL
jgi:hypothetical protein